MQSPRAAARALSDSISAGNLDGATECFATDGAIVTPDATTVHGRDRIRAILAQLIARRTRVEAETVGVQLSGSVALVTERWLMRSPGPGGSVHEVSSNPVLALRRMHKGWRLIHASPWRRD